MFSWLSRFILKLFGWKISGPSPNLVPKSIFVAAPHTSNWDFVLGIMARSAWKLRVNFIGKKALFKWPFGFIFRKLGGYPVDRTTSSNLVDEIVKLFNEQDRFAMAIAPEGTRKKVSSLKSGFYFIAHKANVPIILITINGAKKEVHFSEPRYVAATKEEELDYVWNYFKGIEGVRAGFGIE